MTIHLESHVIASHFDKTTRTCNYTIERGGQRYTASVHIDDLSKQPNKMAKRMFLANALEAATQGAPDV